MFEISVFKSVLYLLPVLVNSQMYQYCYKIDCGGYKTDEPRCDLLAHLEDPFTNKCTPSCDSECVDGVCDFCFCSTKNITTTVTPTLTQECKRIRNPIDCTIDNCAFEELHSCNNQQFMVNPFHRFECVLRCDAVGTNCPNGWCSALGHCTCHLGYRPDVTNPRVCVKIPDSNTTEVEKVCYKGFKLDSKGDCVSKCGECKNGCCDANGVCRCRSGYKFNPKTSSCVFVNKPKETPKEMACSDRCLNGMCDADNVCQCMDCEALTTTSPDCEISQDTTVAMISRICENSTSSDDMVSKATHNTYVGVFVCINLILIIGVIFLVYVIVMIRRAMPQSDGYNMEIDGRS